MSTLSIPAPNPKQAQFLRDTHPVVAYGGARGGGKSWAVRVKAALLCLRYPGIKVLLVRRSYPELQENHIHPLCELLRVYDPDPEKRLAAYNDQKKQLRFPNAEPSEAGLRWLKEDGKSGYATFAVKQCKSLSCSFTDRGSEMERISSDAVRAACRCRPGCRRRHTGRGR